MNQNNTLEIRQWNWKSIPMFVVIHVLAVASLFMFSWEAFWTFFALYVLTAFGITFSFHRLFTHRSFKTSKPMEYLAAIIGTLAMQGNIVSWVGHHRMHHAHSDTPKDPHDASRGFWHSHFGWMLMYRDEIDNPKTLNRFARDITSDPFLRFLGHDSVAIVMQIILGLVLLYVGGFKVMMWGMFVRLAFVYHVTWLVNSASHMFGYKTYENDKSGLSTNCWWVGILALGEGWHNNHHAYQEVAYHGHRWWEFDFTGIVIRILAALGLIWDVKGIPAHAKRIEHVKTSDLVPPMPISSKISV